MRSSPRLRPAAAPRVSLATVARAAGVSVATVSRIANGMTNRANPQTVARIKGLLETLGYRPNPVGQSLRQRSSRIVAMLSPNLDNPAMAAIASSTEAALRAAGYVMILCDTHDQPALQDEYLDAMQAQFVQGYVLVSPVRSPRLNEFLRRREPVVLVNRRQTVGGKSAPFVGIDNSAAGAAAADFLLDAGIENPAIIHSALTSSAIADRVTGFMAQARARGLRVANIAKTSSAALQHIAAGYEAARTLTDGRAWPQGLFCVSDQMAYGAFRHACESGVRIPNDCVLVGIDDNPLNRWIAPWLSSVHVPYDDFGPAVVDQVQALWGGEAVRDRLLPHRLVARTGATAQ
ncbi:MAG: LacI family DNA-binding transcriptional regulator [Beijerinckiaceae bacterium]